jgi:hypothetical protein
MLNTVQKRASLIEHLTLGNMRAQCLPDRPPQSARWSPHRRPALLLGITAGKPAARTQTAVRLDSTHLALWGSLVVGG